jgi:hypothetical protein
MPKPATDWTGKRVGYQLVLERAGSTKKGHPYWLVFCVCGRERRVLASDLAKNKIKSCGCLRGAFIREARTTHGMTKHSAFWAWRSMIDRCRLSTHAAWHNYGGRGIMVCPEWEASFEMFWRDMGPTYRRGLSLDRVDNAGNYHPKNCRWATRQEQARNTRRNRRIPTPWGTMTVAEASERSGIDAGTLYYRVKVGAPAYSMFSTSDTNTALSSRAPPAP